jgi:hypothetical protein
MKDVLEWLFIEISNLFVHIATSIYFCYSLYTRGTWQSLAERSHRPKSHPKQHRVEEEEIIRQAFKGKFYRYSWDGVFVEAREKVHNRIFSGMLHAARRIGLGGTVKEKKPSRNHDRRYPEFLTPSEIVQIDVKRSTV